VTSAIQGSAVRLPAPAHLPIQYFNHDRSRDRWDCIAAGSRAGKTFGGEPDGGRNGIRGRVIGLAVVPMAIIGFCCVSADYRKNRRSRPFTAHPCRGHHPAKLAPAAEYGVASGISKCFGRPCSKRQRSEPDIPWVACSPTMASGWRKSVWARWTHSRRAHCQPDRIFQLEYQDRLVYYAPITQTEIAWMILS